MNSFAAGVRNRFRASFIIWLMVMWCLLMGEVTWANVISGILVGCAIVFLLPLPAMPLGGMRVSWLRLAQYMVIWAGELLWASIRVSWIAIRPGEKPKNAILTAPMRVENELILSFAVVLYNLQPGGTVTDIDIANRTLTVHVLNATTDADIKRELRAFTVLERRMIDIFERRRA
ncbi:MAG: Na+/H+ antiporter subunit E [Corynebacterium sp.]|nr:Na+/H+ antiporter subunit E [Corynebacterium sp.]